MKHVMLALSQIGTTEIRGRKHNPEVIKYFKDIGHDWVVSDETAWCSAFINWICKKSNLEFTGKLNARSWLSVGEEVYTSEVGDLVIFWRESKDSWKGHVGIYVSEINNRIYVLGGNQNNQVSIKPYHKSRLLGFRRLTDGNENV